MKLPEDFRDWTEQQTRQYLEANRLFKDAFKGENSTGKELPYLTVARVKEMGITDPDEYKKILDCIRKLWKIPQQNKVFNDPIHRHMELHPLLVTIINTPQFQRLRNIKQLGGAYYVYPGASHNRFEHSIGVAHLAGELVKALRTRQPELPITDRDILCVEIAGLCHDLGHGPFSHLFDGMFIPKARPGKEWKHEKTSLEMFDHLVKCNKLESLMEQYGLVLSEDLKFIKEMIEPKKVTDQWPYEGRPEDKSFLYEIVSNKRNGVDVDKFDYFARDCYQLGLQTNFDHLRFLKFARVCEVDGWRQICVRDKEEDDMTEMFHTRYCLHRRACQHKVHKIIDCMITDAFLKADKNITIEGSGGKMFTLSTAIDDMEAYTKLTDNVFEQILNSTFKELDEAREILERVTSRDLYKFLGETRAKTTMNDLIHYWKEDLAQALTQGTRNAANEGLTPEEFIVVVEPDCNVAKKLIKFYYKKTADESFVVDGKNFEQWRRGEAFNPEYRITSSTSMDDSMANPTADGYRLLGEHSERLTMDHLFHYWKMELAEELPPRNPGNEKLNPGDFVIMVITMDYGMKDKDPIEEINFYSKYDKTRARKRKACERTQIRPMCFSEKLIRFYCKKTDDKSFKADKENFEQWCRNKGFPEYS